VSEKTAKKVRRALRQAAPNAPKALEKRWLRLVKELDHRKRGDLLKERTA
jgi:hypothetical protein